MLPSLLRQWPQLSPPTMCLGLLVGVAARRLQLFPPLPPLVLLPASLAQLEPPPWWALQISTPAPPVLLAAMAHQLACAPPAPRTPLWAPLVAPTQRAVELVGLGSLAQAAQACAARQGSGLPVAPWSALLALRGTCAPLGPQLSNPAPWAPGTMPLAPAASPPACSAAQEATWPPQATHSLNVPHALWGSLWALQGPLH